MADKTKSKNKRKFFGGSYLPVFNKLLIAAVIGCFAGYLISMNCLAIRGFELKEKRVLLTAKYKENEKLEIDIMNLESYKELDKRIAGFGFVKVNNLDLIFARDNLAKK